MPLGKFGRHMTNHFNGKGGRIMKRYLLVSAALVGFSSGSALATNDIVEVLFEGVVTSVHGDLGLFPDISVGDPVVGSYSYDLNTPDTRPDDPTLGHYATGSMTVSIGTWTFHSFAEHTVVVAGAYDRLGFYAGVTPTFPGTDPTRNGMRLRFQAGPPDPGKLPNDGLPPEPPDLNVWQEAWGDISYLSPTWHPYTEIDFDITAVRLPPSGIPTVSHWGIAIIALLLLVGAKVYFGRHHRSEHRAQAR